MLEGHNASRIRQQNLQAIVGSLRSSGTSSRAALAERLGLSRPTLTHALRELIAAELVVELDERQTVNATGRRRAVVALNAAAAHVLSVDIGGTKTALALHDLRGEICAEQVIPTPTANLTALTGAVRAGHRQLAGQHGLAAEPIALAAGVPGVVRPDGRIDNVPNLPILHGAPLGEALAGLFAGVAPGNVTVENDVNLAAVGERLYGVARDLDHFAYLALGTGLGAGVFSGGRLLRGAQGYAGELGEWRLQRTESRSLESELSGEALRLSAAGRGWPAATTFEIVAAALRGERAALEAVFDLLDRLAHASAQLHTLLDLQAVVLGVVWARPCWRGGRASCTLPCTVTTPGHPHSSPRRSTNTPPCMEVPPGP